MQATVASACRPAAAPGSSMARRSASRAPSTLTLGRSAASQTSARSAGGGGVTGSSVVEVPETRPSADPDAEAVRLFLEDRDPEAFAALVKRHEASVFRVCASVLGPGFEADAEDLAQDVLIHVFHTLSSFRGNSRFSTWLHRLAVNLVLQDRRQRGRRRARDQT